MDASSSSSAITPALTKPKRPLSGYNLFYRYKRNKVLDATVNQSNACLQKTSPTPKEDKANLILIRSIITSLPGLEGISQDHAIWSFPAPRVNELRASNVRAAMEGKLFPNENTRNRLHRKVHGMGFVEMGKIMRDMWAGADRFTKTVFGELADVGRVRYRGLLAEYKIGLELNKAVSGVNSTAEKLKVVKKAKQQVKLRVLPMNGLEMTNAAMTNTAPAPTMFLANIGVPSPLTSRNQCSPQDRTSETLRSQMNLNSLEPLSFIGTNQPQEKEQPRQRRFSALSPVSSLGSGCISSTQSAIINQCQANNQVIKSLLRTLLTDNSTLPPPPLFRQAWNRTVSTESCLSESNMRGSSRFNRGTAQSEEQNDDLKHHFSLINKGSDQSGGVEPLSSTSPQGGVSTPASPSAADFIDLIDTLSDSHHSNKRRPSVIFGNPIHDVDMMHPLPFDKSDGHEGHLTLHNPHVDMHQLPLNKPDVQMHPLPLGKIDVHMRPMTLGIIDVQMHPMPLAGYRLKNSRACMA